ncbi:MAG: hypothetical protein QG552_1106 [Thermodesulfobacteriota bacterium]|nr:hypothetical protein [Thermodesulfobacteriota bacterium]
MKSEVQTRNVELGMGKEGIFIRGGDERLVLLLPMPRLSG